MGFDLATARPVGAPSAMPASSNAQVFSDALYKGAAGVPDLLLNAPNNIVNLAKALFGTMAGAAGGGSDLMPEPSPNPDIVRGALESLGLIKGVQPQGGVQRTIDTLTQGAVGGALTGGASLPGVLAGGGMGALSAGAGEVVGDVTKSPTAGIAASLFAPQAAGKVLGGRTPLTPTRDNMAEVQRRADVDTLHKNDVAMTPGQILGGTAQRVEDAATSFPFTGDFIRGAQRRGHETFNIAATNRALEPVWEKVPPGVEAGRPAVAFTQDRLGSLYEDLLSRTKGSLDGPAPVPNALPPPGGGAAPSAATLRQEIENIRQMGQNLPEPQRGQLSRILDHEVIERFTPNGGLAGGETIKNIESQLGQLHTTFARSDNYDVRTLAGAVKEAQAALRRMVEVENPQSAGELQKINEGYANFKRVQDASGRQYSRDGIATPATLSSAVRAGDKSKDKSKFTRGEALMQDLSDAGKNVMSQTVPDSGTPFRHLIARGDVMDPRAWLGLAVAPAYSSIVQKGTQAALMAPERPSIKSAAKTAVVPAAVQAQEKPSSASPAPQVAPKGGFDISTAKPVEFTVTATGEGSATGELPIEEPKKVAKAAKAPRNPEERVLGAEYETPAGRKVWGEDGWRTPKR